MKRANNLRSSGKLHQPRGARHEAMHRRIADFSLWPRKSKRPHVLFEFEDWGLSESRTGTRRDS